MLATLRSTTPACVFVCALALPATSTAAPDDLATGTTCHVDARLHMQPPPDVASPPRPAAEDPDAPRGPAVLFLNFDGGTITYGPDDAPNNQAWQWSGQWPAYGNGPDRTAALAAVKANYGDFNLLVTDERPASGDYSMIMVGPGMSGGVATLDCNNQDNRNVGFAGHSEGDGWGAGTHAALISHEAGHTFGMNHIYNADNIMNPTVYDGARFARTCVDLAGSGCAHDCGSGQNTYDELMRIFGPSAPDESPPTVAITAPADGDTFPEGTKVTIAVDASDDVDVAEVSLMIDGSVISTKNGEPFSWEANFTDPGMFTLEAVARDDWGNETTSAPVTIHVGEDGGDGGGGGDGGDGSDDGGDDGGDGGSDDGGDGGGLPPGLDGDNEADGCGCTTSSPHDGRGAAWIALAALLGLARRRQ